MVASAPQLSPLASPRFEWLAGDALALEAFQEAADRFAVRDASEQIAMYKHDRSQGFFGRPGWLAEITNWTQRAIEPLGMHLTGTYQQRNASPSTSLLRLTTEDSALWFKAVGDPAIRELGITRYLVEACPDHVVIFEGGKSGSRVTRLADRAELKDLNGQPLGDAWYSGILGGVPTP